MEMRGVSKAYGSTTALSDVALSIADGEIHGLLGQNGSGKSTLIKILAGVVTPDSGQLAVRGQQVPLPLTPSEADRLGLRFVHQNLGLVDTLTVAENLSLGGFARGHRPIDWPSLFSGAQATLDRFDLRVDAHASVGSLSALGRAQVAIARALAPLHGETGNRRNALLVLDEPTVYLPKKEVGQLFTLLNRVVADGHAVLLVTHRLSELLDHTDRVSVLRDARVVTTRATRESSEDELVELAVGTEWRTTEPEATPSSADVAARPTGDVRVTGLASTRLRRVDLDLAPGNIVGLTGLAESGYDEVLYALFGASDRAAGTLTTASSTLDLSRLTPAQAIRAGVALVPVNRLAQGVAGPASIEESVSLPVLGRYFRTGWLRLREASRASESAIARYGIVATGPAARVDTLSGGNQQKVLIAKWLQRQPTLLLLHEPSQGVDVRARHDIWRFVRQAALACPVLVASSDYDELAELCTAVAIVANGTVGKTLSGESVTADIIAAECLKQADPRGKPRNEGGEVA